MRKYIPGFIDPRNTLICGFEGIDYGLINEGNGAPTNGGAGYQTGALYSRRDGGGANPVIYVNAGSNTVANWKPVGYSPVVAIPAATTTLTLTELLYGSAIFQVASTGGLAITPPAATGSGVTYTFVCTAAITGGNFTFDAKAGNASDLIYGSLLTYKATTYTQYAGAQVVSNANLITFDGSTLGFASAGDWFRIQDMGLHIWEVTGGFTIQSGTIATPFSNH